MLLLGYMITSIIILLKHHSIKENLTIKNGQIKDNSKYKTSVINTDHNFLLLLKIFLLIFNPRLKLELLVEQAVENLL